MSTVLTVVIPTHNPRQESLARVLTALRSQTLPTDQWDLVVIDNASAADLNSLLRLDWHPAARVVREEKLGLTPARMRGFQEAKGEIVVLVDDDNELRADYLERVLAIAAKFPFLGTWGGSIVPEFENPLLEPPKIFHVYLACRTCESDSWSNDRHHHGSTPWGAGMCVRRTVFEEYLKQVHENPGREKLDLQGKKLLYGGDTDIAYVGCGMGLGKGVFSSLHVTHLIPSQRCKEAYLISSVEGHAYSGVIHEFLLSGRIMAPRTDIVGKIGVIARWPLLTATDRKIASAARRGVDQAVKDLKPSGVRS